MTTINEQSLMEGLLELSDECTQANLWNNADGNTAEMSSFEEAVCFVFDDSGATRAMEKGQLDTTYGAVFAMKLAKLDSLVGQIPSESPPEEVIRHPKMVEIRAVAGELFQILKSRTE